MEKPPLAEIRHPRRMMSEPPADPSSRLTEESRAGRFWVGNAQPRGSKYLLRIAFGSKKGS